MKRMRRSSPIRRSGWTKTYKGNTQTAGQSGLASQKQLTHSSGDNMSTIEIKAVGPISSIEFDLPEGSGGVKVLKGTSGVGKSTALLALSGLIGDKDALSTLTPHDGQERGEIVGLGRSVKVGQRVSATGTTLVPTLGGRLDVATLVDPKVIDPTARTKARVKCLVSIGGLKLTPKDLLGEEYDEIVNKVDMQDIAKQDDPIAMADKLKRSLDSLALSEERESDRLAGMAAAKRQEAGDVDQLNAESVSFEDAVKQHRQAMQAVADARNSKSEFESACQTYKTVMTQIESMNVEGLDELQQQWNTQKTLVDGLRQRLAAAESRFQEIDHRFQEMNRQASRLKELQSQLKKPECSVTDETIASLEQAENAALARLTDIQSLSHRRDVLKESFELQQKSQESSEVAGEYRAIGTIVLERVQKALPAGPLQIKDGTLVVQHDRRKKAVPFDKLSTGERWRVAMEYAIAAVGAGGVIPLHQEAWQSLGPELKAAVAKQCHEAKVWLISASVEDGGELRVEDFDAAE